MNNKQQINRLRDNAELAWAAYGYFHFANPNYDFNKDEIDKERLKHFRDIKRDELIKQNPNTTDQELQNTYPTHTDILNMEYKHFRDEKTGKLKDSFFDDKLFDGDFTPTQAKNFFEHYELLEYCPNTDSGFSATLFKDTKADSKDSEYILSFRGTEFKLEQIQDLLNDYYIGTNNSDMNRVIEQYFDMLLFYEETLKPLLQEKGIAKINVIGHSLGGYLAQLFALSYPSIINEVYTYNTSLESKSVA
ncbi:alpha/beta fold hydrolase [uncultured Helicobacter sp.]|uniref:alpha/beta fold hydrolase n=1 Tax=uncultured Helicobacter sp. TaxID=175537 RepID=UPI002623AA2B|nr:alpha/beta fold hydrolase [uncultured Helicobacter sp.]